MKKYFVKVIATATDDNPSFAGMVEESLYGKDQKLLESMGEVASLLGTSYKASTFEFAEYGYNRLCDAKKSWIYKNFEKPDFEKFWTNKVSIVEKEF